MTAEDLLRMVTKEGLYILEDDRLPGGTGIILSLCNKVSTDQGAVKELGEPSRLFLLTMGDEVSSDWRSYPSSTRLLGGPFSLQTCRVLDEKLERLETLEAIHEQTVASLEGLKRATLHAGHSVIPEAIQHILDDMNLTTPNTKAL